MKHVFIVNPAAGKKDSSRLVKEMADAYFSAHPEAGEFVFLVTNAPGDATRLAKEYAHSEGEVTFYSCGGDGTTVEVFNGMLGHDNCILTSVPLGSGNDFLKAFGSGCAPAFLSLEELVPGCVQKIDHLRTNGLASLNITTAGFDADVCVAMNKYRRTLPGKGAYFMAVADRFCHSLKNRYAFEVDGKRIEEDDHIFAIMANGRYYGGAFHPAPFADITDGYLDFITIPVVSRMEFVRLVGSYSKGNHFVDAPKLNVEIQYRRAKKVQILGGEFPINIDGEVISMTDPLIEIVPQGVRFKLPQSVWENYEARRSEKEAQAELYLTKE